MKYWLRDVRARLYTRYRAKAIFVHINKTGGTSIERALGLPFQHRTAREIRTLIGQRRWDRRFRFTFIRNPWDKVASHYRYRVKTNQTGLGRDPIDFTEWVRRAYGENDPRYYDQPKMFMPQLDWITDERGELLVEFVGRFENIDRDFQLVCERLGVRAALPHLKKTARADYRALYDDESAEVVARWFARDIERFGYRFD